MTALLPKPAAHLVVYSWAGTDPKRTPGGVVERARFESCFELERIRKDRPSFGFIRIHSDYYFGGLRPCVGPDPDRYCATSLSRNRNPVVSSTHGMDRGSFHSDPVDLVGRLGVSSNRLDVRQVCVPVCFANSYLLCDLTIDSTEHYRSRGRSREALQ